MGDGRPALRSFFCAGGATAISPPDMTYRKGWLSMIFPEERTSARGLFPFPAEGETVEENPPCLTWIPPEGRHTYTVTLWDGEHRQLSSLTTDRCYAVPELLPGAGQYFFDVEGEDGSRRGERSFFLSPGAVTVPRRSVQDVLDGIPAGSSPITARRTVAGRKVPFMRPVTPSGIFPSFQRWNVTAARGFSTARSISG